MIKLKFLNEVNERCMYYLNGLFTKNLRRATLSFSQQDMDGVYAPHYASLLISMDSRSRDYLWMKEVV